MSYGGDTDRGPFLNVINWVFNVIALVAVALRLVSRRMLENKSWAIDDAFIILAIVVNLARTIYVSVTISMGYGQHLHHLLEEDPVNTVALGRLLIILQAIGLWTFTLPKLPVVALLVRIFSTTKRLAIVLYSMVIALILLVFVMTITTFAQCTPIERNWNPTIKVGRCWDPDINLSLGYLAGSYSAFLDFVYAIYPIVQVSTLQMERSRQILIATSLSLGFVAGITTMYKLTTIHSILDKGDPTWATIPLEVWNSVEGTALIIAASVPMTRPIMSLIGRGVKDLTSRLSSIVGWSSGASRGTTQLSEASKLSSGSGLHRLGRHSGQQLPKSDDEILLQETSIYSGHVDDMSKSSMQH